MKKIIKLSLLTTSMLLLASCSDDSGSNSASSEKPEDAPDTWIADRTITGLVFQSASDAGVDTMSPEISEYIKERTGITFELETVTSDSSLEALTSGLAAGDLPDFIAFYLDNSGRPEFPPLLQAANEGMFHDISPYLQEGETYGKYYEEGYLPTDTRENIMMRDDQDGSTYLVHMNINEEPADPGRKMIGGPFIRTDIAEELEIDPQEIKTTKDLQDVLEQIDEGDFTDENGNPVTPLGPTVWGGSERSAIYQDLVWEGPGGQKFAKDEDGNVLHESMTDYAEKRVKYVRELLSENLMHPEFYTMEENRTSEGVYNGSFGIISDIHSFRPEVSNLEYVPLGPIERYNGDDHMVMPYKSGYAGWAVPETTENPEEVVAFADWMASEEGKRLYLYGLEGEHYEIDEDGNTVPLPEIVELADENPDEAKKLGFRGVGAYWGEHLSYTNMNNLDQFGEESWGDSVREEAEGQTAGQEIAEIYNYDKRYESKEVIDGLYPRAYLFEFEGDSGPLATALDEWDEQIVRAYYAGSEEEAQQLIDDAKTVLENADIKGFTQFLEEKEAEGDTIYY